MKAEKLFLGNILTMDERYHFFKAMTVTGGKVTYVGSESIARQLCDENTEIIDFGENFIYPGMIEGHCHPDLAGMRLALQADLSKDVSMEDYCDTVRRFVESNPELDEYRGSGWSEKDEKPCAAQLDRICAGKPVVLNSIDGHSMWLNTKAMEKYGINADAVRQWGTDIVRINADGTPTGYVSEGPVQDINLAGKYTSEQLENSVLVWQKFAFEHGFTAVMHAGIQESRIPIYKKLINEGKFKLKTYACVLLDEREPDYPAAVRKARELADKYNDDVFRIIGIKVFMDGVVEAHTAWLRDGYNDDPENTGVKRMRDPQRFTELLIEAAKNDLIVHCHTIGDGAIDFALDCIEKAETETGRMNMRNALAHLQVMRPDQVDKLVDLNVVGVVAPLWTAKVPGVYEQEISYCGKARADASYPIESIFKRGGFAAFHSDYPVSSKVSIPRSVYMAVTRRSPGEGEETLRNPAECTNRFEALAGLTTGAAYSVCDENRIGKLDIGYAADMTVYDVDFLNDDIEKTVTSKHIATIVNGEIVWKD